MAKEFKLAENQSFCRISDDGKYLLIKETAPPGQFLWYLRYGGCMCTELSYTVYRKQRFITTYWVRQAIIDCKACAMRYAERFDIKWVNDSRNQHLSR